MEVSRCGGAGPEGSRTGPGRVVLWANGPALESGPCVCSLGGQTLSVEKKGSKVAGRQGLSVPARVPSEMLSFGSL